MCAQARARPSASRGADIDPSKGAHLHMAPTARADATKESVLVLQIDHLQGLQENLGRCKLRDLKLVVLKHELQDMATDLVLQASCVGVLQLAVGNESAVSHNRRPIVLADEADA